MPCACAWARKKLATVQSAPGFGGQGSRLPPLFLPPSLSVAPQVSVSPRHKRQKSCFGSAARPPVRSCGDPPVAANNPLPCVVPDILYYVPGTIVKSRCHARLFLIRFCQSPQLGHQEGRSFRGPDVNVCVKERRTGHEDDRVPRPGREPPFKVFSPLSLVLRNSERKPRERSSS